MNVFVIVPSRAYGLDVVVPLLYQLRERFPKLKSKFIVYHKKELMELRQNIVLYDHVKELGSLVKAYGISSLESVSKNLNRFFKFAGLVPVLLSMLFSRRSVVLYPRRIETFIDKIIVKLNGITGKTFCYLMATTSLQENLPQYFDKEGNRRPGIRTRPDRINVADGLLAYRREDNAKYLELQGYKDNLFIGYPMMYPAFQKRIRDSHQDYLKNEIGADYQKYSIVTIFLNKYYGKTSVQNDRWAQERLIEAVTVIRQKMPDSYILIRAHPMVPAEKLTAMIKALNAVNIKQTHLHIYVLACSSRCVISIAQSSSGFHALAFGAPVIDYGRIHDEFYRQFPGGSLYADFGVKVAYNPEELALRIHEALNRDQSVNTFKTRLGHQTDLKIFERYWAPFRETDTERKPVASSEQYE